MNVAEAITAGASQLEEAGVPEPVRDTKLLVQFSIGRDAAFLIAHPEHRLSPDEMIIFGDAVARRAAREPVQYIVGHQEFYGLDFVVTPAVLIPRPETEMLVSRSLEFLPARESSRFLDIGCGSGCISIAILGNQPDTTATAVDISDDALAVAQTNAENHSVAQRLQLLRSDIYSEVGERRFDLVISNPPYIPRVDIDGLQPEVRDHEPFSALSDNADGTSIIARIIRDAPEHLNPGGLLLIEIGFGQEQAVREIAYDSPFQDVSVEKDLQGIPRMFMARMP